jgi:hypothetical protein
VSKERGVAKRKQSKLLNFLFPPFSVLEIFFLRDVGAYNNEYECFLLRAPLLQSIDIKSSDFDTEGDVRKVSRRQKKKKII